MNTSSAVKRRINFYNPKGGLGPTAKIFLAAAGINNPRSRAHSERVALLSEAAAKKLRQDPPASFFGGLFHDFGNVFLPASLFDGQNLADQSGYEMVKTHAQGGFSALKKLYPFTALCAGLNHNLYDKGYGAGLDDIPKSWSPLKIKKVLTISKIISIANFADDFTSRKTEIKDDSGQAEASLKAILYANYPNDQPIVDIVLDCLEALFPSQAKNA